MSAEGLGSASLDGRVAIVTGASSGIGEATARLLAAEGALTVLTARRAERLRALAGELPGALALPADARDPDALRAVVRDSLSHHGRVDILVNNAGQGLHVPLEEARVEDVRAIFELNVLAPLVAMQAVLPAMRERRSGHIVNVGSGTSRMTMPGVGAYAASKAALDMLSATAREELRPDGIVVSLVRPSVTASEFHEKLRAGARRAGASMTPHSSDYVARVIVRALRTGEAEIDIPHGPEREDLAAGAQAGAWAAQS